MKRIAVALVLLSPLFSAAQLDPIGQFNRYVIESWAGEYHRVGQYKVKGSNMLFGQSLEGKLNCKNMEPVAAAKMLYDLSLQIAGPDVDGKVLEPANPVESFEVVFPAQFGGAKAFFRSHSYYANAKEKQFYQVLKEGAKAHFLKAYKVKVVPDPSNLMDKDLRIFEQYAEYFIFLPQSQQFQKVKLQKKSVMEALASLPGSTEKAAAMKVDFSVERDVAILVESINQ